MNNPIIVPEIKSDEEYSRMVKLADFLCDQEYIDNEEGFYIILRSNIFDAISEYEDKHVIIGE